MNYSENYKLQLPLSIEKYNVAVANTNHILIDSALKRIELKNESQDNLLATKESLNTHTSNKDNPHQTNKSQVGLNHVTNDRQIKGLSSGTTENNMVVFGSDGYSVKDSGFKAQYASVSDVGFTQLEDSISSTSVNKAATPKSVKQTYDKVVSAEAQLSSAIEAKADQSELNTHTGNNTIHITASERTNWNDAAAHKSDVVKHITSDERTLWNTVSNKVDKISGKGLSANDYTADEKSKLAGIAAGAEVNVQSDWNVTSTDSDSYIKNKPVIPTELSQLNNDTGFLTAADIDTSQTHTHANKNVIDQITQADLDKLDGIAANANKYIHPTASGSKHIPSGGSSGQILRWSADGTAVWGNDNNTTYTTGTASSFGLTKLYTATGSATDGTITQSAITTALNGKLASNGTAVKASADASGNTITSSYASSIALSGQNILLKSKSGATLTTLSLAALSGGIDYSTAEPTTLSTGMTWIGTA